LQQLQLRARGPQYARSTGAIPGGTPLENTSSMVRTATADNGMALAQLSLDTRGTGLERTRRNDAHIGIHEIDVLRADLDMVTPASESELAPSVAQMYRGTINAGDHLRLPLLTNHDGPSLRAAVGRVIDTDTSGAAGSREDVLKEAKMLRVLRALEGAVAHIQRHASMTARY
jgi:hypothetical protein